MLAAALVAVERRFVYLTGGVHLAHAAMAPKVIATGLPERDGGAGSLIAAELDDDERWDFIITGVGYIAAYGATGARSGGRTSRSSLRRRPRAKACPGCMRPACRRPT
jgi:hypothetical protein